MFKKTLVKPAIASYFSQVMKTIHLALALLVGTFVLIATAHDASAKRPSQPVVVTPPPPPPANPFISQK
jgi:hypothetical protein